MSWTYFKASDLLGVNTHVIDAADKARGIAGVPFIPTSGFRTPEENAAAGGVADSAHLKGLAIDWHIEDPTNLWKMINGLQQAGFQRIVLGLSMVNGQLVFHNLHTDMDATKPMPVFSVKLY